MSEFCLISLEGNIGAGKTTLLNILNSMYPEALFLQEPLSAWQNINNNPDLNLFNEFYRDPSRWAFTFQTYAYQSRFKYWMESLHSFRKEVKSQKYSPVSESTSDSDESSPERTTRRKVIIFTERSLGSDRWVFLENARRNGLVSELEYQMYIQFYDWLLASNLTDLKVQGVIYLSTNVEECFKRLTKRQRSEEQGTIGCEYLAALEDRHQEWLFKKERDFELLSVDSMRDYVSDLGERDKLIGTIDQFVRKIAG